MQPQTRPITVQDLLRHTAGLVYPPPIGNGPVSDAYREANVLDRNTTLAEMVTKISKLPLAHQPGEVWEYSAAVDVLVRAEVGCTDLASPSSSAPSHQPPAPMERSLALCHSIPVLQAQP